MNTITSSLPLIETFVPQDRPELAQRVAEAYASRTPIYPWGGGTGLCAGLTAKKSGWGLSMESLSRVIDYPHEDMTITVEAGITMAELARQLAVHGQRLPIDAPQAEQATLGGVVAANVSGPRRYGCGTIRDYVIGIQAVDGRGVTFHGGGRVVKNVAGYDFCKLLTGSQGTLAIITQLTLKVRPLAEAARMVFFQPESFEQAEKILASLVQSQTTPTMIEWVGGSDWLSWVEEAGGSSNAAGWIIVGFEGSCPEVDWQVRRIAEEADSWEVKAPRVASETAVISCWQNATDFSAGDSVAPMFKGTFRPSELVRFLATARKSHPQISWQSQAGNGVVFFRLPESKWHDITRWLVSEAQPSASAADGSMILWSNPGSEEATRLTAWGPTRGDLICMQKVKQQFDPVGILNPGRYLFD